MFAWVDHDGLNLDVFCSTTNVKPGAALLTATGSLFDVVGSEAYFGFTASTGAAHFKQQVNSFDLRVSAPSAVPLSAARPMFVAGFAMMGGLGLRRRRKAL